MVHNTTLQSDKIVVTVERLARRIEERFPESGLHGVCLSLHALATRAREEAAGFDKPIYPLRIAICLLLIVIGVLLVVGLSAIFNRLVAVEETPIVDLVSVLEAGTNEIILIGFAVAFFISLERRIKRGKALRAIHELRAVAHVIDMHQLTKDPVYFSGEIEETASSPTRTLSRVQLMRYLDYCSEMLSLTGKLAALYIQRFDDPTALSAANDVEALCTQLSRKIWQKVLVADGKHETFISCPD